MHVIVFDFGNVIAFFDHDRALARIAKHAGVAVDEIRTRAQHLTNWIRAYEHGDCSSSEFLAEVQRMLRVEIPPQQLGEYWADIFWLNEPVARIISAIDTTQQTLILGSNTNQLHSDHFRRRFAPVFQPFRALVLSHEIGHMKPAAPFYEACAAAADASPHDCIFVDDLPGNVAGASASGMPAIHFTDHAKLARELAILGVRFLFPLDV